MSRQRKWVMLSCARLKALSLPPISPFPFHAEDSPENDARLAALWLAIDRRSPRNRCWQLSCHWPWSYRQPLPHLSLLAPGPNQCTPHFAKHLLLSFLNKRALYSLLLPPNVLPLPSCDNNIFVLVMSFVVYCGYTWAAGVEKLGEERERERRAPQERDVLRVKVQNVQNVFVFSNWSILFRVTHGMPVHSKQIVIR